MKTAVTGVQSFTAIFQNFRISENSDFDFWGFTPDEAASLLDCSFSLKESADVHVVHARLSFGFLVAPI